MEYGKTPLTAFLLLLLTISSFAQDGSISIVFNYYTLPQTNLSKLWDFSILSQKDAGIRATLQLELQQSGNSIYQSAVQVDIQPGLNDVNGNYNISQLQHPGSYSNSPSSKPYTVCVYIRDLEGKLLSRKCQGLIPEATSLLHLIYPFDKEKVDNNFPVFSWTNIVPLPIGLSYDFKLVEILEGQTKAEALMNNPAHFSSKYVTQNIFPYPPYSRELETNKSYAWQVIALSQGQPVALSEQWEFEIPPLQNATEKKNLVSSAIDLDDPRKRGFYPAQEEIVFKLDRKSLSAEWMEIRIVDEFGKELKEPQESLEALNHCMYRVNLLPWNGLENGNFYFLKIIENGRCIEKLKFKFVSKS